VFSVSIICEPQEETRFANPTVSNQQKLPQIITGKKKKKKKEKRGERGKKRK